jgi:hypothetical protein
MAHSCGERGAYCVWMEKPEGKRQLRRTTRKWRKTAKLIFKKWDGGVDWIDLVQDEDKWRVVVNTAMNIQVPWNAGNFSLAKERLVCYETLCVCVMCCHSVWIRALHYRCQHDGVRVKMASWLCSDTNTVKTEDQACEETQRSCRWPT